MTLTNNLSITYLTPTYRASHPVYCEVYQSHFSNTEVIVVGKIALINLAAEGMTSPAWEVVKQTLVNISAVSKQVV